MSQVTYYVALPFVFTDDGLSPGVAVECISASAAIASIFIKLVRSAYFSEVLIEVNLVLSFVPRPFTTAMMASEMPAAIRP